MLQKLQEIHAVSDTGIKEAENMDHEQNQTKIIYRYAYLGGLSAIALLFGIMIVFSLHDYEQKLIVFCSIVNSISFVYNVLMMLVVSLLVDPSDIEKMRKIYISQYIEGIFIVLAFSILFTFLIRPN